MKTEVRTRYAMQASTSVRHLVLPCHWSQRSTVTGDLVRCYGALGRTIVFCDTKKDCNELVTSLGEAMRARALHGDIPQQQREVRSTLHHALPCCRPLTASSSSPLKALLLGLLSEFASIWHVTYLVWLYLPGMW
jgi:hypothetical protein